MMKKLIPSFLGLLVLVGGLGAGIVLVQENQDIREKAAEVPDVTTSKIIELASSLEKGSSSSITTYRSETFGYQLNINKNVWMEDAGTDLTKTNLSEMSFNLKGSYGNANVKMKVYAEEDFIKAIAGGTSSMTGVLDSVANYYQRNPDIPSGARITTKEKVEKAGRESYRFTISQTILGIETQYYQYLTLGSNKYYVISANYPASLSSVSSLAEDFVDSFIFATPTSGEEVKGTSTEGSQVMDEVKIAELVKPSVVNIVTLYCNNLIVKDTAGLKHLKQSYRYCDGAKGTGFFISEAGYIGTNGHVVKVYPEMSFISGIETGSLAPFLTDLVKEMVFQKQGLDISDEQAKTVLLQTFSNPQTLQALLVGMYGFLDQGVIAIEEGQTKYYVKIGNQPILFDESKIKSGDILNSVSASEEIKEAELIAFDFPNMLSVDAVLRKNIPQGSDVAIIKLRDSSAVSFPSLKLGDSITLKEGESLIVVGYPGLVEGSNQEGSLLDYQSSSAKPTITRGIVSAIKTDKGGKKLIQTDASIDNGNSGGPAFNQAGEVIGIATYGFESQSGNYNFLRDIGDLKELANKNSVAFGESGSYLSWETGLFYFWDSYYRKSLKAFNLTKELYPEHPEIDTYISDAQVAVKGGKDKGGIIGALTDKFSTTAVVIFFVVLIAGGVGGAVFLIIKRKKGQAVPTSSENQTVSPQPQLLQQTSYQTFPPPVQSSNTSQVGGQQTSGGFQSRVTSI